MSAKRTNMHRLQELVRLHRMGEGPREVARLLEMSPKTEGKYRRALIAAGLLAGPVDMLPPLEELKTAVTAKHPVAPTRVVTTSLDPWIEQIVPAANSELAVWLDKTAATRIHGTTGRAPGAVFEAEEKAALDQLPLQRFELVVWKRAKVHTDSHVEMGGRLYSVPWRHVGKEVWIRATHHSIEVHRDDVRIATHDRRGPGRASTQETHLPEGRRDLRHRSESYWRERAGALHTDIGAFIAEVFASDHELSKLSSSLVGRQVAAPAADAVAFHERAHPVLGTVGGGPAVRLVPGDADGSGRHAAAAGRADRGTAATLLRGAA